MKILLAALLLLSLSASATDIHGHGQHRPRFLGFIPYGSANFQMRMKDDDSIGSVMKCMDKVHSRGGGTCGISPGSLKAGKHMNLDRKYPDVLVSVTP